MVQSHCHGTTLPPAHRHCASTSPTARTASPLPTQGLHPRHRNHHRFAHRQLAQPLRFLHLRHLWWKPQLQVVHQSAKAPRTQPLQPRVQQRHSHHRRLRLHHPRQPGALHLHARPVRALRQLHLHLLCARCRPPSLLGTVHGQRSRYPHLHALFTDRTQLHRKRKAALGVALLAVCQGHRRRPLHPRLLFAPQSGHACLCRCRLRIRQQHLRPLR